MNGELNIIMQKLTDCTLNLSVGRIVGELSIVVERLAFAEIDPESDKFEEQSQQISFVLEHDVSPGIAEFVQFLIDSGRVGVLLDEAGKMFPEFCKTYFSDKKQLTFVTAHELSHEMEVHVRMMLMRMYPVNTRILFEADPEIVAGFVIQDKRGPLKDYSARTKMVKLLESYLIKHTETPWKTPV